MASPRVSVVIPTYNRPGQRGRCLRARASQQEPGGGFEVVVVDDGGEAPLEPVLAGFRPLLDVRLVRLLPDGSYDGGADPRADSVVAGV